MLYNPYACLEFWPSFCSEAMLPFVSNGHLFMIYRSPLYKLLPMHSTDDGCVGYPGDSHSYLDYSSDSLPFILPDGVEPHEQCRRPVVRWLVSPRPPCTHNIEVQTVREVVPEKREEGAGVMHTGAHWRCFHGHPYCYFGAFHCYSCMAQEGGESNWSDSSADGYDKIPLLTPSSG